ncbi:TadE/TadG family type IV pilus assembly protein [Paraburkholderia phenazinium]|jgi:Flp pilus assembly protein TadG|uniref:Flp pilus assembly protein TadG n=1 Tax=Paraburkholderia phenazinium TaxID=60549 RepID=A0A1G8HRU4_9BURK|nr:TadE/TadG family type IV pilus assembly protein [Paraburkholderia phenazinium]SDI09344.1 Flp pilus assembly protein TadG [Paraburkholderia phenazinium]
MKRNRQSGAAVVEFALVLPVLFLVLFGAVQFGTLMNNYLLLTDAASVGAHLLASERGYATPYSDTEAAILSATSTLKNTLAITISVGGTTCTSDTACASALGTQTQPPATGTEAKVSLSYTFSSPFKGALYSLKSMMPTSLSATMSELVQ